MIFKERLRYGFMRKNRAKSKTTKKVESKKDSYRSLEAIFNAAPRLFDFRNVQKVLEGTLPYAEMRAAVLGVVAAALLSVILNLVVNEMLLFTYESVSEISETEIEMPVITPLISIVAMGVLSVVLVLAVELLAYWIARAFGGKGTYEQQLYLFSAVNISIAIASFLILATIIPCAGFLAAVAYFILTVYLSLYVRTKAYVLVHGLSLLKAFVVVIIATIVMLLLSFAAYIMVMTLTNPEALLIPGA